MLKHNLPTDFIHEMQSVLGETETDALIQGLSSTPSISIRRNPKKGGTNLGDSLVDWCKEGRYLNERPQFTLDPLFHAGTYYVQEASSMFIEHLYQCLPSAPQRMLDLCAAPGGKSTHWRTLLPEDALLVANEPIRNRAMILAENISKWGYYNTIVTNAYPKDFASLGAIFDVIAADVPCSGEGMFRKDEQAIKEWSLEAVDHCAERQRNIINDIWPTLKEGGYLIYSTCTFNKKENEDNIAYICETLGAEVVEVDVPKEWNIVGDLSGRKESMFHFLPGKTKGEGFFCCLLRKISAAPAPKKLKNIKTLPIPKEAKRLLQYLSQPNDYQLFTADGNHFSAIKKAYYNDVLQLSSTLRILRAGIEIAESKGKKWQPRTELALSLALNKEAFPYVELNLEETLHYLHREAIQVEAPKGYVIVGYKNQPLGFVNNLGTRANNLYPTEWRIRKDIN